MEEDDIFTSDEMYMDDEESSFIEDRSSEDDYSDPSVGNIVGFVEEKYSTAETARYSDEQRWIRAYRNYRGIYGPDVQFTSTEKSKIFVKVTKTKVLAAYSQLIDVLFGTNKFPITIDPTTLPDGVAESVHFETNPELDKMAKQAGDQELPKLLPGETLTDFKERVAGMAGETSPV